MSKIALGRGLGSLIPQKTSEKTKAEDFSGASKPNSFVGNIESVVNSIETEKISKNPAQMRKSFDKNALAELAESIKVHGILEPLLVSELSPGKYQLIAGERRFLAAKLAGLKRVPAIVREVSGQQSLEFALIENIQRENLNPIEEAKAYKMLAADFGLTQEDIARKSGKSRSRVANFLRLLSLPFEIQNAIGENKISEGHGRAILALENPEKQRALLKEIISRDLTVRQAEEKTKIVSVAGHTRKIGAKSFPWRETEKALSDFLSARVEIKKSGAGAKVVIDCPVAEELDRIIDVITAK